MPDFNAFFLNGSPDSVLLETLVISHPNFTRTYALVNNAIGGITATLEDGTEQVFQEYPFIRENLEIQNNLDFGFGVQLGDLGEIIPKELDAVRAAGGMNTHPTVVYRSFSSADLSEPLDGPYTLRMVGPAVSTEGTVFRAEALSANASTTGNLYTFDRFPMLRGLV